METFGRLLAPLLPEEFMAHYWQKRPFLRRAPGPSGPEPSDPAGSNPAGGSYDWLFRIEQLDEVFQVAAANASEFDYFAAGSTVPQSELTGPGNYLLQNRLLGYFAQGGTIHLSNLQKYAPTLSALCQALQAEFYADVEADLWLTRENRFEPYLHFDRYDIVVLQVHGKKRWRLFERLAVEESRVSSALDWAEVAEPILDVELCPGDLLYLPTHFPHVVTTVVPYSLHIGLGLHPLSYRQVLQLALEVLAERPSPLQQIVPSELLRLDPTNRPDLAAALGERVSAALATLDFAQVKKKIFDRFVQHVTAAADRHLTQQILSRRALTAATPLALRPGTLGSVSLSAEGRACLVFSGGGTLSGPAAIQPALEFILAQSRPFTIDQLPGTLDTPARLLLMQRLIDSGLCVIAGLSEGGHGRR